MVGDFRWQRYGSQEDDRELHHQESQRIQRL
jgi:hypothetical protein